jgi:hypothetical protein
MCAAASGNVISSFIFVPKELLKVIFWFITLYMVWCMNPLCFMLAYFWLRILGDATKRYSNLSSFSHPSLIQIKRTAATNASSEDRQYRLDWQLFHSTRLVNNASSGNAHTQNQGYSWILSILSSNPNEVLIAMYFFPSLFTASAILCISYCWISYCHETTYLTLVLVTS